MGCAKAHVCEGGCNKCYKEMVEYQVRSWQLIQRYKPKRLTSKVRTETNSLLVWKTVKMNDLGFLC